MIDEQELREQFDDDALFGDVAVQAIMGLIADGVNPDDTDEDIGEGLKEQVIAIECALESYITDRLNEMIEAVRESMKQ